MNDNSLKKKSELKNWIESLIDLFRKKLNKIDFGNLDYLPHSYNFEFPCQIELFWLDAANLLIIIVNVIIQKAF